MVEVQLSPCTVFIPDPWCLHIGQLLGLQAIVKDLYTYIKLGDVTLLNGCIAMSIFGTILCRFTVPCIFLLCTQWVWILGSDILSLVVWWLIGRLLGGFVKSIDETLFRYAHKWMCTMCAATCNKASLYKGKLVCLLGKGWLKIAQEVIRFILSIHYLLVEWSEGWLPVVSVVGSYSVLTMW